MERNEKLIKDIADRIEDEPEHYSQGEWLYHDMLTCETTACIAGWAWSLATGKNLQELDGLDDSGRYMTYVEDVRKTAGEVMGLTNYESIVLFGSEWKPHTGLSVPDALRKIAEGAEIADVTHEHGTSPT